MDLRQGQSVQARCSQTDMLLSSEVVADILKSTLDVIEEGEEVLDKAAHEVAIAVWRSSEGVRLMNYHDLPY